MSARHTGEFGQQGCLLMHPNLECVDQTGEISHDFGKTEVEVEKKKCKYQNALKILL